MGSLLALVNNLSTLYSCPFCLSQRLLLKCVSFSIRGNFSVSLFTMELLLCILYWHGSVCQGLVANVPFLTSLTSLSPVLFSSALSLVLVAQLRAFLSVLFHLFPLNTANVARLSTSTTHHPHFSSFSSRCYML